MGLVLRLLGTPLVEVDGRPLEVDTRKATAMLVVLAVRDEAVSREALASMLWPDAPPERARASLRRTLSALTSGLGGRFVTAQRDRLCLAGGPEVTCDVRRLRAAVRDLRDHDATHGGDPATCDPCATVMAAALGRGVADAPLLEGFTLRDAPPFDDWVQLEAESLRRDLGYLLERRTSSELAAGRPEAALASAHEWSASDPLHEGAHRAIMRAAAALGRRDEAIRQYRRCVAILDRELGVSPLAETTALYAAILDDAPVPATPPRPAPPTTVERQPDGTIFVDRDEELAALQRVHRELQHGVGCVVIEGEAGIGKTRIATEFVEYVSGRGGRTLTISCRADEVALTCGPVIDALRDALERDPSWVEQLAPTVQSELTRILPELSERGVQPAGSRLDPGAQARFLDAVFAALAAAVVGRVPGVIVVDDLHWADPTTVDVLVRGRRRHPGPVLVLGAWRTELVGHDHPLRRSLANVAATPVLRPGRLTRDQVAELVADLRPTATELVDRLHAETEGIPFFLVQYLAAMDDDGWQVPTPVRDLVASRLAPLSDLARQCLTAGAILGRSFELTVLVRTSGRSEDEVVTALDELLDCHLLVERPGSRHGDAGYDFTHSKVREVVLGSASLARRRLLHRRAAEALLAATDDPALAARVARHLREAGEERRAAEQHALAGWHARSLFANVEAIEHLSAALALGHPATAELRLALGDLHALAGRYSEARTNYTAAAATVTDPTALAELEHRLGVLHLRWGAFPVAARHLEAAAAATPPSHIAARARIQADRAIALLRVGTVDDAARAAADAVRDATACGDLAALAQAHNTAGLVARHHGELEVAHDRLRAALGYAGQLQDPTSHVAALNNLALVLGAVGRTEEALAAGCEALRRCAELGDRHREAALHSNVADLLHAAGRTEEALPHLTASARLLADVGEGAPPEPELWKLTDW